jgi:hypothetical protein
MLHAEEHATQIGRSWILGVYVLPLYFYTEFGVAQMGEGVMGILVSSSPSLTKAHIYAFAWPDFDPNEVLSGSLGWA